MALRLAAAVQWITIRCSAGALLLVLCLYVIGSSLLLFSLGLLPSFGGVARPSDAFKRCAATTVRTAVNSDQCVLTWRASCCPPMPPLRLVATGDTIIDQFRTQAFEDAPCAKPTTDDELPVACARPPVFYRQYTNAYQGKHFRQGIAIITDEHTLPSTVMAVRRTVLRVIDWAEQRALPFVRGVLSGSFVRVAILSCRDTLVRDDPVARGDDDNRPRQLEMHWETHPEGLPGLEMGGGTYQSPTTGVEEVHIPTGSACFNASRHRRLDVTIEEFFHTIHTVVMQFADRDAFDAIVCLSVRDTLSGAFNPLRLRPLPPSDAGRLGAVMRAFSSADWKETVAPEYFIAAVAVWLGSPGGDLTWDGGQASRALLKHKAPALACLVARYFPDVGETDGDFCSTGAFFDAAGPECRRHPGSCYCGLRMADAYLGPALKRSEACDPLDKVKESTGLAGVTLPGSAADVKCSSCRDNECGRVYFGQ